MTDHSRAGRPAHARTRVKVVRLHPSDAPALTAFLHEQDVWPAPREPEVAEFLGRADVCAFGALASDSLKGVISAVNDRGALRITWLAFEQERWSEGPSTLAHLEAFGKLHRATAIFAQVPDESPALRLLLDCGLREDHREQEVTGGSLHWLVDVVKILGWA